MSSSTPNSSQAPLAREFTTSNDGEWVVAAYWGEKRAVVIHVADGKRWELPEVSYSSGGRRLAIDGERGVLFTGAYTYTGIAAYNLHEKALLWQRRDLGQVQYLGYDSHRQLLYCGFDSRAARPLNPQNGRERNSIRNLQRFWFSPDSRAVFEFGNKVTIEDRSKEKVFTLKPEGRDPLRLSDAAFTAGAAVLAFGGRVVAHDSLTGKLKWSCPAGYCDLATARDGESVWVLDHHHQQPPCQRIRLLSANGDVVRETRLSTTGIIIPFSDRLIQGDLEICALDDIVCDP